MILRKYGYAWITLGFFLISLLLHWYFGWQSYVAEAAGHGQAPQQSEYVDEMLREMFENWQSEFLQLLWQVCGLAYFLYVGSPSSKENDDRVEAKVDALLIMQGKAGFEIMERLDKHFLRTDGHPEPHGHEELDDILGILRKRGRGPPEQTGRAQHKRLRPPFHRQRECRTTPRTLNVRKGGQSHGNPNAFPAPKLPENCLIWVMRRLIPRGLDRHQRNGGPPGEKRKGAAPGGATPILVSQRG